jgi:NAD(P)-dependent dehydrogenase (short-subunit alcohol dehydrogenase family)
MTNTNTVHGRAVLITGASRGLGAALARSFARAGSRVVGVARSREALEQVVRGIRAEGGEAHALVADIAEASAAARIAGQGAALVGPIDVLVHNASTLGHVPLVPLTETHDAAFMRALSTNLVAAFRLTRAFAGSMALRGSGLVVHVTSDAATTPYPGWGVYGVSKAALEHLGRIWDAELAPSGVRFVNLDPGEMDTQMHRDALPTADRSALADPEAVASRMVILLSGDVTRASAGAAVRL